MAVTINLEHTTSFLKEDIKTLATKVSQIHHDMHKKVSRGNDFLGWLDLPFKIDREELMRIEQLKAEFKDLEVLVVVGIGGSYLGAKAGLEFLRTPFKNTKPEIIFAGHHLSSEYLSELLNYLTNKDYAINVISKSGTTTEPALAFRLLKQALEQKYGTSEASRRIFATTDKKRGALYQLAVNNNYERFVIPDDVGGRYSVFTAVGLLPFVFANINVNKLLQGALDSFNDLNNNNLNTNIAYQYAATRYLLYKQGYAIEMLVNYEPKLIYLSEWWKQLFGESEGKENKGLFVASAAFTTDLHSLGQYIQQGQRNIFETIISVDNVPQLLIPSDKDDLDGLNYLANKEFSYVNKQAQQGTLMAHLSGGVPNIIITIDELDEYNLGYLLYFFELSCAMSAYLLDVNPFDQPGVEDYKKNMFALLGKK